MCNNKLLTATPCLEWDSNLGPKAITLLGLQCLVAEPDKVLVRELNEWVTNPLGPGQTSAQQIQTRSA